MLDICDLHDFIWYPLIYKRKTKRIQDEIDFRECIFDGLKADFKYHHNMKLTFDVMNKIFLHERAILSNVGNIRSYYDMLIEYDKGEVTFEYVDEINKWTKWTEAIGEAEEYFILSYGFYPNVAVFNKNTLSQINFIVSTVPQERKWVCNYDKKA